MIGQFINFLKDDINSFISSKKGVEDNFVVFANLNNVIESTQNSDNKIVISIVNIEEEKLIQSPDNYIKSKTEVKYKNPPVWLNFICLFTFYTRSIENYDGIDMLANVVQYFQSRPRINKITAVVPANFPVLYDDFRAEFVSLNYEQTNYLWGLFGGKYHPSVVYKFKTIPIDNLDITPGGPPILNTQVDAVHKK
jgi:hypothetical protein